MSEILNKPLTLEQANRRIAELEEENAELLSLSAMSDLKKSLAIRDLEQQAKGIDRFSDMYLTDVALEDSIKYCDNLRKQAKLKEQER